MAISSSLATKAGAAGTLVAGTGLGGTYLAWDHITLYAVEREVINKDVKLTVTKTENTTTPITVSISGDSNPRLDSNHVWTCEITLEDQIKNDPLVSNLEKNIQSNLQTTGPKVNYKLNKELLVKACAKKRKEETNGNPIKGSLTITKHNNKLTFKGQSYIDFLLANALYAVEKEVIRESVQLTPADPQDKKITVTAAANSESSKDANKLQSGYAWSCEITVSPNTSGGTLPEGSEAHVSSKLKEKFTSPQAADHKTSSELLVKSCSKKRKGNASDKSVAGQLTVKVVSDNNTNTYSVEGNSELNSWFN